jgi:hypothetical protein
MTGSFDAAPFDAVAFEALQAQLVPMWPTMTLRRQDEERTLVVVSSISVDVPEHIHPLLPAYEERYLIYVLGLVQAPRTKVVYVTSQPVLPRMLDYYLGLIPGLDRDELRSRLIPVSVGDWSPRPLTEKILERPRLLGRLRSLIDDPHRAVLMPFVTTLLEARLAVELGIPVYGPHPDLSALGTKSGSREVFAAAGVSHPRGAAGLSGRDDLLDALDALVGGDTPPVEAIVKLEDSVSGFGNALIDLRGVASRGDLEGRLRTLVPEQPGLEADAYVARFDADGGVVEERIAGDGFCSPSVQLRASPEGGVEVLATHDQVLGGPRGQTYVGCRFPADPEYAVALAGHGTAIAEELATRGVIGRFAVDFVATRSPTGWVTHAVEINLRNGGTTHPTLALLALTEGDYLPDEGRYLVDGTPKHYVATDHLEPPGLRTLTPDDVLDVSEAGGLGWDDEARTGVVFHMLSGVGVAGTVGLTAIADNAVDADGLYDKAAATLTAAALEVDDRRL